jgi:hypothetical protein
MEKVFVAGSRVVSRLNNQIRERLDNIMKQDFTVLIGDANGADKAVQQYLARCHYENVIIHSMDVCRNNIGKWPVEKHRSVSSKHDRHYYGIKDFAMAQKATCGLMLWDGKSRGTLTNVINLLSIHKKALLYLGPKGRFFKLCSFDDLAQVLHANGIPDVDGYLFSIGINKPPGHTVPVEL